MDINFKPYMQTIRPPSRDWGAKVESDRETAEPLDSYVPTEPQKELPFYRPGQNGLPFNLLSDKAKSDEVPQDKKETPSAETLFSDALAIGRGDKPVGNFDLEAFKALRFKMAGEKHFEERLPERSKEMFKGLSESQKEVVIRVGSAFGGDLDGTPLVKLMEDGRLFEKDSSGHTPLQRLAELTDPDRSGGGVSSNFLRRMLGSIENPGEALDTKRKDLPSAENSPAEFIRAAGEEYDGDQRAQGFSQWSQSPEAIAR